MTWVLVVAPKVDLRMLVKGAVQQLLRDPATEVMQAANRAEADALVRRNGLASCRLVVCSPSLPRDADEPPAIDGRQLSGVAFVRDLREGGSNDPPVVFIAALADGERIEELQSVANARLVVFDEKLWDNLPQAMRTMLKMDAPVKPARDVDLDIVLRCASSSWTLKRQDGCEDGGTIAIQRQELQKLIDLSRYARNNDGGYLQIVGREMFEQLMRDPLRNDDLRVKLQQFVGSDGMRRARIRFSVDEDTQRILLETLLNPGEEGRQPELWMMNAPMFRKLGTEGRGVTLFRDAPVNCLLLEGQTQGFDRGTLGHFEDIPQAAREIEALAQLLEAQAADSGIGNVDVLRRRDHPKDFADVLARQLRSGAYQLVHYAGHSALGEQKQPWLVLGDGPDEVVHARAFCDWAQGRLQFIFLSSCDSADAPFVLEVVKNAPSVVGYAWPADDEMAGLFARTFYGRLFGAGPEHHMLEDSFMAARQVLHDRTPGSNDWAAPLLFMQVMEKGKGALGAP